MQNRAEENLFKLLNQNFEKTQEKLSQLEELIKAVKCDAAHNPGIFESENDAGHSFLTIAIANNWPRECITMLIKAGCDPNYHPNYYSNTGASPLIQAIKNKRMDCVTLLLELKVNINSGTIFSPLMWAISQDKEEFVRKLLEAKADINQKNVSGNSSLRVAVAVGNRRIVSMLLENKADVNSKDDDDLSVLYRACELGEEDIVKLLIEAKASMNETSEKKRWAAPINIACTHGDEEIVKLLLSAKASISKTNEERWAPINIACYYGHEKILSALLEAKADVNSLEKNGSTPLHYAAQNGHAALVPHLLTRKASLDQPTADGITPLMLAAGVGHASIVDMLLEAKADPSKKDKNQKTAVDYALAIGSYQCLQSLIPKTISRESKSLSPTLLKLNRLNRFINERVKALDSSPNSILDKFFLEEDPTFPDGFWYLPPTLHCATMQLDLPKIKQLIERKQVDADALDCENLTAIEQLMKTVSIEQDEIKYLKIAKFLFDNTKQLYGRSLLHLAALSGKKAVLELFVEEFYSHNDEQLKKI